jgi:hypothetical protein
MLKNLTVGILIIEYFQGVSGRIIYFTLTTEPKFSNISSAILARSN